MQLERGIFRVFRYRTQTLTLADFNRKGIYLKDIEEERKISGLCKCPCNIYQDRPHTRP